MRIALLFEHYEKVNTVVKYRNNWKTEEALARAAVTLQTDGSKGPILDVYDDDDERVKAD